MTNWISVNDRLPDKDGRYLVCEIYFFQTWIGVGKFKNGNFELATTHWQPLPEPPEKE